MKQEVIVKGAVVAAQMASDKGINVMLTRAQLEAAIAELNAPESRQIGPFGTEAFMQNLGDGPHYYLPFSERDQEVLNDTNNTVAGIALDPDGTISVETFLSSTRTVKNGKLGDYPVVKGRLVFIPEGSNS